MYLVTLSWQKAQKSKLRRAVEKGFAPLTVGLIMATSLVMSRAADHDWRAYLITGIATVIFVRTDATPDRRRRGRAARVRGLRLRDRQAGHPVLAGARRTIAFDRSRAADAGTEAHGNDPRCELTAGTSPSRAACCNH